LPRPSPARALRPPSGPRAALARWLRARALPLPACDPARLPHRGGTRDEDLPAATARTDQDEAAHRLVVDAAAARLRRPGAQAMIRVAVIGAGQWGPNLIRNFHNKQTSEVTWIIDRDAARLAEVQARFPDVQVSEEPARAFSDPAVDAVVVATPTSTHFKLAQEALEQRKHV